MDLRKSRRQLLKSCARFTEPRARLPACLPIHFFDCLHKDIRGRTNGFCPIFGHADHPASRDARRGPYPFLLGRRVGSGAIVLF